MHWLEQISIRSPVKRETIAIINTSILFFYFNPLPRKEGDAAGGVIHGIVYIISIRSPVKRETDAGAPGKDGVNDFNPLPRKEGDT